MRLPDASRAAAPGSAGALTDAEAERPDRLWGDLDVRLHRARTPERAEHGLGSIADRAGDARRVERWRAPASRRSYELLDLTPEHATGAPAAVAVVRGQRDVGHRARHGLAHGRRNRGVASSRTGPHVRRDHVADLRGEARAGRRARGRHEADYEPRMRLARLRRDRCVGRRRLRDGGRAREAHAREDEKRQPKLSRHRRRVYPVTRRVMHATFTNPPGRLAQLGERRLDKAEVAGSSPASPTSVATGDSPTSGHRQFAGAPPREAPQPDRSGGSRRRSATRQDACRAHAPAALERLVIAGLGRASWSSTVTWDCGRSHLEGEA